MKIIRNVLIFAGLLLLSCDGQGEKNNSKPSIGRHEMNQIAPLEELSDVQYPDNPDVLVRHAKYTVTTMQDIEFESVQDRFTITVIPDHRADDTVVLEGISLMEFIPTIPERVKDDDYLSLIAVVNQEWNRNQVRWQGDQLNEVTAKAFYVNGERITRVDLARNCLNAYLWELFFYTEENEENKVFYHGWFHFPERLYQQLFYERNHVEFEQFATYLKHWRDPKSETLNFSKIREETSRREIAFVNHDKEKYPVEGERRKKQREIIYPMNSRKMSDFHTDSSRFATFTTPGFYNKSDPRTTQLGRFQVLNKVEHVRTTQEGKAYDEFWFEFARFDGEKTRFVVGGLNVAHLPRLSPEDANKGVQLSMGIGNHPFYEDAQSHEALNSTNNPYFGVLMTEDGRWLDSHTIGIDGPLLHGDLSDSLIVHVWLLSFERHALVGHYELKL